MAGECEGILRIRGAGKNIIRFLDENLNIYKKTSDGNEEPIEKELWIFRDTDENNPDALLYSFSEDTVYVEHTYLAYLHNLFGKVINIVDSEYDTATLEFNFRQYNNVKNMDWVILSLVYGVDFRLFAFNEIEHFYREVEIIQGHISKNRTVIYEDWDWESPYSMIEGW